MSAFTTALAANTLSMGIVATYFIIQVNHQLKKSRQQVAEDIAHAQEQVRALYSQLQITDRHHIADDVPPPRGNS